MANKTRTQLNSEVLARLGETTGFYTAAQINQWLVDGVDDIAVDVEPLVGSATANMTISQTEYSLPSTIISVKQVVVLDDSDNYVEIEETTWEALFRANANWTESTASTPTHWYWRQDALGLYPQPTETRTNGIKLLYTYRPTAMAADSDTTGLPEWLDRAVCLYAVARCFSKDRNFQAQAAAAQEYRAQIAEAKRKLNKHRKEHAPRMVPNQKAYRQYYQRASMRPTLVSSE